MDSESNIAANRRGPQLHELERDEFGWTIKDSAVHVSGESPEVVPAADAAPACLCCVCGTVSLERDWTYWQRADDEAPDWNGEEWRPSRDGECDPMMRCPACKWEHTDTEDGSGVYMGTLAEMEAQREADLPEFAEWWAERLAEVAA